MQNLGVIDLGTNTFHLLLATITEQGIVEAYRERIFVKLAEDDIHTIGDAPFQRAVDAICHFKTILDQYEVTHLKAFGTAALRTASNGPLLTQVIKDKTNISIDIISGSEEARLIYEGVRQAVPFGEKMDMIMDIGGGSVEFIIANQDGVQWAQSFPIGVAVLFNRFHKSDPILSTEIQAIESFLEEQLSDLKAVLKNYNLHRLIGASGTFDVLEKVLQTDQHSAIHSSVDTAGFTPFYNKICFTSMQERLEMDAIPNTRAQLIIVALVLIDVILKMTTIQQIDISAYAMKEGILREMRFNE